MYCHHKIILLCGKKQAGKSTAANMLFNYLHGHEKVSKYSFATALKQFCVENDWITYEQAYGTNEQKNSIANFLKPIIEYSYNPFGYKEAREKITAREVLQFIGTDIFRKIDPDIWIRKCVEEFDPDENMAIIDDGRFANEVYKIKEWGGIVIWLQRNIYNDSHSSETELESIPHNDYNYIINNQDYTEEQLEQEMKKIAEEILNDQKVKC